eukprot:gb/GFBE01034437.1/.p1 GENE.gb/GFBE01034437.1/~~gb/GFBE01034437.1/.p1  ORF type:complete len:332 (+),score=62.93 gb/GFBE01034437.1/:1-996(+)
MQTPADPVQIGTASSGNAANPAYTLSQFSVQGELGAGAFGVVQRVVNRETGQIHAMKVLEKTKVVQRGLQEQLKREVLTQLRVKHENLVRLQYYFEDAARIYCLLEFADGGQLFAYLKSKGMLPDARAASFFFDTASGLNYLHGLSIAHRDLKPENILLFGGDLRAKLGDFGWCVELTKSEPTRLTFCGTLDYVSPEMLKGEPHDLGVDLWALGVLLFEMLLARAPFAGSSKKETIENICSVKFEVPVGSMSPGAEELVRALLVEQSHSRMRPQHVLSHTWRAAAGRSSGYQAGAEVAGVRLGDEGVVDESQVSELVVSNVPRPKTRSRRG